MEKPVDELKARPGRTWRQAAFIFIFATVLLDMLAIGIIIPVLPKLIVDFVGGGPSTGCCMSRLPGVAEVDEASVTAFGARTMPGCECGGFVEEEQFGVGVRCHHCPLAAPELQHASEPPLQLPRSFDVAFGVVQPAPIAHERSSFRSSYYVAQWNYTVLSWHKYVLLDTLPGHLP